MKVVLVTPYFHQFRGNTVTVQRISKELHRVGISTEIVSIEENLFPPLPEADLVHGFNAWQFYRYWMQRGSLSCPYMVTITGTDLNHSLLHEQTRDEVIRSLNGARAIHVFNRKAKELLWREVPGLESKTFLIPQGIMDFPLASAHFKKEEGNFLFVLPAGIRRVKNVPAAISMLSSLYEHNPGIRLWIVGPAIEEAEENFVRQIVERNSRWIRYLGQVSHHEMGAIYRNADVVLNTSLSEGQSSAILEAMASRLPVVASDIAGNRDIVSHGTTGFLYRDEYEFTQVVSRLMEDAELRKKMGLSAQEYVRNHHSTRKEVQALTMIYQQILQLANQSNLTTELFCIEEATWKCS